MDQQFREYELRAKAIKENKGILIPSSEFTFVPESKRLVAEISNLCSYKIGRVLQVKSVHTGLVVEFVLTATEFSDEGDITKWVYAPRTWVENCKVLVIYND